MTERVTARVLGALRLVGAPTRTPIAAPLVVTAPEVQFIPTRRGLFVVKHVPGLEKHETADASPPTSPSLGAVHVRVAIRDPSGHYLPRSVNVDFPRDPSPDHATATGSLFTPIDVELYPSPTGTIDPGWAVVRVSVKRLGATSGVPNAYLRIRRAGVGGAVLARGFADARGEAMVPVAGLPVVNWQSSVSASVLAGDIDALIEAFFDPSQLGFPPDPDAIEAHTDSGLPSGTTHLSLASGRHVTAAVEVAVP